MNFKFFSSKKDNKNSKTPTRARKSKTTNATFKIGNATIFDNYLVDVNLSSPINTRIIGLLDDALSSNNLQYAFLHVPLDIKFMGEQALTDKVLCLLIGKLSLDNVTWFVWAYRNYNQNWYVCATAEKSPSVVERATQLVIEGNSVTPSVRHIFIPAPYINRLNQIITDLQRKL